MQKPYDPIDDDDLDIARRRLRYLAEKACGELDAQTVNTLSFHLGANLGQVKAANGALDVWAGDDAWTIHKMGEIEAAQEQPMTNLRIPRADLIRVTKMAYAREPVGDAFVYHYTIDTKDNPYIMRLGIVEDMITPIGAFPKASHPQGWLSAGAGWINLEGKATLAEDSEFSIQSKWRPGLIPMFIMSHAEKESGANIFDDSLCKFVIGPAIKPDITKAELNELIDRWVNEYGFSFLAPLLKGKTLDDVKATGDFETEVLKGLRAAMPKA